jgi:hypothetical protein
MPCAEIIHNFGARDRADPAKNPGAWQGHGRGCARKGGSTWGAEPSGSALYIHVAIYRTAKSPDSRLQTICQFPSYTSTMYNPVRFLLSFLGQRRALAEPRRWWPR